MALYMVGFISYGATLVFYAAIFPRLARNTPQARKLRDMLENGEIDRDEYEREESLEKNRISNISTTHSNIGYIVTLCLNLSILLPLANNLKSNNYAIVLTNAYWVLVGIWWCMFISRMIRTKMKLIDLKLYFSNHDPVHLFLKVNIILPLAGSRSVPLLYLAY